MADPPREQVLARAAAVRAALRRAPVLLHERFDLEHALPRLPPPPRLPVHQRIEARLVLLVELDMTRADVVDPLGELCLLLVLRPALRQLVEHVHVLLDAVQHRAGARTPRLPPVHELVEPRSALRGQHILALGHIMNPPAQSGLLLRRNAVVLLHVARQCAQHLLRVIP